MSHRLSLSGSSRKENSHPISLNLSFFKLTCSQNHFIIPEKYSQGLEFKKAFYICQLLTTPISSPLTNFEREMDGFPTANAVVLTACSWPSIHVCCIRVNAKYNSRMTIQGIEEMAFFNLNLSFSKKSAPFWKFLRNFYVQRFSIMPVVSSCVSHSQLK